MAPRPRWHHMLMESQRHALKAVDEWNSPNGSYGDFVTHMHKAWHYLLHAEFHRAGVKYHYLDQRGHVIKVDGEAKAWALEDCLKHRYLSDSDPVRLNVELFVKLRNKLEHRYEHGLKIMTGGKAQALVINYETEMTCEFGPQYSLADRLRFPLFLHALGAARPAELEAVTAKLPRRTRELVTRFEAGLEKSLIDDLRYDYRIRLVPIVGPKTSADLALSFVNLDALTDEERKIMIEAGRTGSVIIRERHVDVVSKNKMLPRRVAELVQAQLPFEFTLHGHHTRMWQRLGVRPTTDAAKPHDTDPRYCLYDEAVGVYVYTEAWVRRIVNEIGTVEKFRAFFGQEPRMKVTVLPEGIRKDASGGRSERDLSIPRRGHGEVTVRAR